MSVDTLMATARSIISVALLLSCIWLWRSLLTMRPRKKKDHTERGNAAICDEELAATAARQKEEI